MNQEEQVLVVERALLDQSGTFQGITFNVAHYLSRLFVADGPRFMLRSKAESDPAYKQLIPYVIMTHGDRILSYVRGKRGGEGRLTGRRSIGIGGHVNPADDLPLFGTDYWKTYYAAVKREVAEEINITGGHADQIVALLNDDSTEVGRVHLGIVHYWTLYDSQVARREQAITQLDWMDLNQLQAVRDSLETWSQFCLDHLPEIGRCVTLRHGVMDPAAIGRDVGPSLV